MFLDLERELFLVLDSLDKFPRWRHTVYECLYLVRHLANLVGQVWEVQAKLRRIA